MAKKTTKTNLPSTPRPSIRYYYVVEDDTPENRPADFLFRPLPDRIADAIRYVREEAERRVKEAGFAKAQFIEDCAKNGPIHTTEWADDCFNAMALGGFAKTTLDILDGTGGFAKTKGEDDAFAQAVMWATRNALDLAERYPRTSSHSHRATALAELYAAARWAGTMRDIMDGLHLRARRGATYETPEEYSRRLAAK